jgi:hypothetical protein
MKEPQTKFDIQHDCSLMADMHTLAAKCPFEPGATAASWARFDLTMTAEFETIHLD